MSRSRSPSSALSLLPLGLALFAMSASSCRAFLDLEDPSPGGVAISEGADCDHAIAVSLGLGEGSVTVSGSTSDGGARATAVTPACKGAAGPERIYAVTAKSAGFLTARLSAAGTHFNSVLYAATTCDDGPGGMLECADRRALDGSAVPGGEVLSFPVGAGETRFILVDGAAEEDSGDYELVLDLSDGDDCDTPISVVMEAGTPMTLFGDTTPKKNSDTCTSSNAGKDVVYAIKGPSDGGLEIEVRPTGFDVTLYLRSICADSFTELTCQDQGAVDDPEGVVASNTLVSANKELYVWVDSAATGSSGELGGPYRLILTPVAP